MINHIFAVLWKQLKDTLKNKAILIQFVMFPGLALVMEKAIEIPGMPEHFFANLFAIMYVVLIRPQKKQEKKQRAMTNALEPGDERDAHAWPQYRDVDPDCVPMHECLKDNIARTWPYFESEILPQMKAGKRILIAAHGNSLRSLVKQFDGLSDEEIIGVNIPTAVPLVYKFDADMNVLEKRYIGDPAVIAEKVDQVANQGKAK